MTSNEAAKVLGLEPDTIRQQCQSGKLRATKRSRDWWVTPREVERYRKDNLR